MKDPAALPLPSSAPARRLVFALACAASWLLYLHRYAWGVLKPELRRINPNLTDTDLGWLDSAFNATYALGQVPGGLLGDLLGPRFVLSGLILLWALATYAVAWTVGFWPLLGVRAALGFAQAGAYPTLNRLTRDWFPLATRTSVQGAVTAMGRLGAACAPLLVATVLMGLLGLSWQSALLVLVVPALPLAAAFWLGPRQPPETSSGEGQRAQLHLNAGTLGNLAMLLVYAFTSTFQDMLYVYWIPLFLVEGKGFAQEEMGFFAPLPLLGGALGGVLGGVLNDALLRRLSSRRWARSSVACTGKFVAALLIVLSVQVADGRLAMVVLLTARVFSDWSLPTQWGAITDMGGRAAGTLFGIVNMVGAAGGFVAGPVLGLLKQYYGWDGLFFGVAAMCFVAALSWLFIDCTRRLVAD
jgi:MFS transporter, ACS family, glucarate transporter